jgi:signal transduction histidine kinase
MEMQQRPGGEPRRRRSARFTRGDDDAASEEQLSRRAEAERERAAIELFTGAAAHELMEPLITAETLARSIEEQLDERADGATRCDLECLVRAVSRMRLLVETLLLDARSHGRPLERRPVSLEGLVRDSIALLDREIRARDARILATDLPVVRGDAVMLAAVVNNLLVNALRYGPRKDGEVRIEARRERTDWKVSVTSRGPTLSMQDRARIFEPYRRGTHERRVAGAGLGLTICRSFVERHGGVIGVAPAGAGGNRFHFTLPATGAHPTATVSQTAPS